LFGCSAAFDLAMTGAGQSAQIENIGFFKTTDDLISDDFLSNYPDYYYISSSVNFNKLKKIVIPDFSSKTNDFNNISSLQISEFKNLRQDIPDSIARTFDGSIFQKCSRIEQRIDDTDIGSIKKLKASAVLFGNISYFKTGSRSTSGNMLTTTQVEIKLVDRKKGQEIIKMVIRSSSDSDKISMPIVRNIAYVVNEAKNRGPQLHALSIGKYEVRVVESKFKDKPSIFFNVYDKNKRVKGVVFDKSDPEDMKLYQSFKIMDNENKIVFVKDLFRKYNFKFE
jgi:hypothetical protein